MKRILGVLIILMFLPSLAFADMAKIRDKFVKIRGYTFSISGQQFIVDTVTWNGIDRYLKVRINSYPDQNIYWWNIYVPEKQLEKATITQAKDYIKGFINDQYAKEQKLKAIENDATIKSLRGQIEDLEIQIRNRKDAL
jgi:hypothetical protein